jgi:hypothetical protein
VSKRVIKVELSEQSIEKAIRELNNYKKWLQDCTEKFLKELADAGVEIATAKFRAADYDGTNDVSVSVENRDKNKIAVVAVGGAVLFIEFGTGIKYPNDHPEAGKNGFTHGGYGHHLGRLQNGWRYQGEPGTHGERDDEHPGYIKTKGNKANMCMYETIKELEDKFEEIARRVYV